MNYPCIISEENKIKILKSFKTMAFIPGKYSNELAKNWLSSHSNCFSGFVNNSWLPASETVVKVQNPFTSEHYADVSLSSSEDLNAAAKSSAEGLVKWESLSKLERSDYLFKIASVIEKHAELFALVECISSGKTLQRIKRTDVPNLIQSFNYYASLALRSSEKKEHVAGGVVCVVAEECNEPSPAISWRISSVLAAGNVVLLLVDMKSCLSAFLLADLCLSAGFPPGLLNILPIDQSTIEELPSVNRVVFTGSILRSKKFIEMAALHGIPCVTSISKQPVVIVYETANLDAAADGVLEVLSYSDTRSQRSGCQVLIQTSVQKKFLQIFQEKFSKITTGCNFSKTDMTCLTTKEQKERLFSEIKEAEIQGFKIIQGNTENGEFPALINKISEGSNVFLEIDGGPIVIMMPFRTIKESVSMFNLNKQGCDVSIWSEHLSLALEVTHLLKTGTIWVNSQNLFDASVAYSGAGVNSQSCEGGEAGFFQYRFKPVVEDNMCLEKAKEFIQNFGTLSSDKECLLDSKGCKTYEHYIGGSFKKPAGNMYKKISLIEANSYIYAAYGSASDVNSAISSASTAQSKWENVNKFKRSQILRKAAAILKEKKEDFVSALKCHINLEGSDEVVIDEVHRSIQSLNDWSTCVTTIGGTIIDTLVNFKIVQDRFPVGVIGIQVRRRCPLLSFVSFVSAAITLGNAVVVLCGEYVSPVLKMCEVFKSSGVPDGVVNVITGCDDGSIRHLCSNPKIDAFWFDHGAVRFIYNSCAAHPKRVFDCQDYELEENNLRLILESTKIKTTFMPMGTAFAN